jgi:predicted regulator of Ras-like GTPase activity (Roadblock/LC7/MglB family)
VKALLSEALAVPGVRAVAVINGDGDLLGADQHEPPGFAEAGSLLAAALAASNVLAESLGGGLEQTVLEFEGGPLVLAVAPHPPGTPTRKVRVLALRLRALADLGRARFELPRLLAGAASR